MKQKLGCDFNSEEEKKTHNRCNGKKEYFNDLKE